MKFKIFSHQISVERTKESGNIERPQEKNPAPQSDVTVQQAPKVSTGIATGQVFKPGEYPKFLDIKSQLDQVRSDLKFVTGFLNRQELEDRKRYLEKLIDEPEVRDLWEKVSDSENYEPNMSFSEKQRGFIEQFYKGILELSSIAPDLVSRVINPESKWLLNNLKANEEIKSILENLDWGTDLEKVKALRKLSNTIGPGKIDRLTTGTSSSIIVYYPELKGKTIAEAVDMFFPKVTKK
jgi:hypothetical protein